MELTIYYSVEKSQDSPVVKFFETEELAEFHLKHLEERWPEATVGNLTLDSSSDISCLDIITKEQYLAELVVDNSRNLDEFKIEFFNGSGYPEFKVAILNRNTIIVIYKSVTVLEYGFREPVTDDQRLELELELNSQ